MFSVSSPFGRPPLPCSRDHVTEVTFTALSVYSFHYFQHILVDVSFWLCALKICLQCIPFVPGASQLVYQLLPCGCEKRPRKSSVWLYFGPQFKSTAHHCGEVMAARIEGRGTARFRIRNGNRNCPDEEFRWNEERNGPGKAGGACLNQGRSFDSRQDRQETGGEQTEVGQLHHQVL